MEGELIRVLALLKMRFSDCDRALRTYTIEDGTRIDFVGRGVRAEGLLTGPARPLSAAAQELLPKKSSRGV